jgi:tetraacyldisaccharide 4'-kinase
MLLPAGRLRESVQGKERANTVIVTKCPTNMAPMEYRIIAEALQLRPYQRLFFSTFRYGKMVNLDTFEIKGMHEMSHNNVLLVSGIGCPRQMQLDINKRFASVKSMNFHDHHYYDAQDIENIRKTFLQLPEPRIIITTEKDATKLLSLPIRNHKDMKNFWVLPIGIRILQDKENMFNDKITGYVQKNLRNR